MDFIFLDKLFKQLVYNPLEPLLFNSGFFLFFFFFILLFNRFFHQNKRAKVFFLMTASIYFYYKSSGVFFYLLIISSLVDYYAGKFIYAMDNGGIKKKFLLILSIATNLGILGYFKYTNFFIKTINAIGTGSFELHDIFLPVGISFFTFQSI